MNSHVHSSTGTCQDYAPFLQTFFIVVRASASALPSVQTPVNAHLQRTRTRHVTEQRTPTTNPHTSRHRSTHTYNEPVHVTWARTPTSNPYTSRHRSTHTYNEPVHVKSPSNAHLQPTRKRHVGTPTTNPYTSRRRVHLQTSSSISTCHSATHQFQAWR